ncbi:hypothetical protein [Sciscionella sediminilitoris]|uniref:hypothetical protein n=1 Tax=Sciscionella sediminilitoris TaxID=1445613 RepID=UPI0012E138F7|nr:hypothetical protein [Sciscionella sp. SE31]
MKSLILWILAIAALVIGVKAVQMHEFLIAGIFAAVAVVMVLCTGSANGKKKKKKSKA